MPKGIPETTTDDTVTLAALKAELAAIEAQQSAVADENLAAAVEKATASFRDAGQPFVVADLVRGVTGPGADDRVHRGAHSPLSPAQVVAMVAPEKRAEFLARLDALVADLRKGHV